MEKIAIGKIVNVVGLRGEVKVYNYSDSSRIYEITDTIYVGEKPMRAEQVRQQKGALVLKLRGIDDRDAAERVRGSMIYITEDDLPPLAEGEYYIRDLIGMRVIDEDDELIGDVSDVLQNTAQDIFEIRTPRGKTVLIPKVDQFVLSIDPKKREIRIHLIDGLLDL